MRRFPRSNRIPQVLAPRSLVVMLGLLLPLLAGCPGALEGNFPPLSGAGGMTGSGGTNGSGGGGACDPTTPTTGLFAMKCPFCHTAGAQPPDLTTPPIAMNLVGINSESTAMDPSTLCPSMPFIDKTNPSASVILKRVMGTSCGALMPLGSPTPDPTVVSCLTSWVMAQ